MSKDIFSIQGNRERALKHIGLKKSQLIFVTLHKKRESLNLMMFKISKYCLHLKNALVLKSSRRMEMRL